jgi:DNA topoisomerase-1
MRRLSKTILKRRYTLRENKQFVPTELGFIVVDLLNEHFGDILDVEFTAKLEENLDAIERRRNQLEESDQRVL